ncbi:hypothetical protein [Synechococcus sp. W55.1]|uniref:hypothetical protein n=1 Tax=Synechococcus sp. W55.1 TaxID=2964512 RepID=UPI0039C022B0
MARIYPQVLERNPRRLTIALQPLTGRQMLLRASGGVLLVLVGSELWARSLLLGLVALGAGLWIGIPWGLGQILSLDCESRRVTLTRLRGPWGIWRQQVFSYPLAQLQGVRMYRIGQEVLDNQAQESFQVQSQVRLQFRGDPSQLDLKEEVIACLNSQVGIKGNEPEAFVLSQRLVRWIQTYLSEQSGNPSKNSS